MPKLYFLFLFCYFIVNCYTSCFNCKLTQNFLSRILQGFMSLSSKYIYIKFNQMLVTLRSPFTNALAANRIVRNYNGYKIIHTYMNCVTWCAIFSYQKCLDVMYTNYSFNNSVAVLLMLFLQNSIDRGVGAARLIDNVIITPLYIICTQMQIQNRVELMYTCL